MIVMPHKNLLKRLEKNTTIFSLQRKERGWQFVATNLLSTSIKNKRVCRWNPKAD